MITTTAITGAAALTLITGRILVHKITVQSADPSIVKFYDSVGNAVTWVRPTYSHRVITSGETDTITQQDCCGSPEVDIDVTGATDESATVSGATVALTEIASVTDGCCCNPATGLICLKGLTALGNVNATVIVEWSNNLP